MSEKLTEELLDELLGSSGVDGFLRDRTEPAITLASYLQQLLDEKHLKRVQVVRMADLNETFGHQIFTGARHPSRDKVLQICFAMALSLREANRALGYADAGRLDCRSRRDAIIIYCLDKGCSLQKVNEELYRFGERTIC